MKLSEIKGDRTLDVLADMIGPISNLAQDKKVMEIFTKRELAEGEDPKQVALERIKVSLPALLKDHKEDFINLLSIIEGVTPEEYAASLTMPKLLSDVVDILTDEEILGFLS